ncbi:MAG TPA: CoA transferase subunit A [Dehalococcoidia bacterium]|nr:CoA transferase subunit A [Dehalococcoidia bacterium]
MDKILSSPEEAVADIQDGSTIMFGGFGVAGIPFTLIKALYEKGTKGITAITNSPGGRLEDFDLSILFQKRQIRKVVASYPVYAGKVNAFEGLYLKGEVELEIVPQGTFAERIRAGGAGIPGFYTPTGVGTVAEEGKEKKVFDGKEYLLELALRADFALIKAHKADRMGNLTYRMTARNFNPLMATAAAVTIAEVDEIVEVGELDPESVVTPGIYVNCVIKGEKYDVGFK